MNTTIDSATIEKIKALGKATSTDHDLRGHFTEGILQRLIEHGTIPGLDVLIESIGFIGYRRDAVGSEIEVVGHLGALQYLTSLFEHLGYEHPQDSAIEAITPILEELDFHELDIDYAYVEYLCQRTDTSMPPAEARALYRMVRCPLVEGAVNGTYIRQLAENPRMETPFIRAIRDVEGITIAGAESDDGTESGDTTVAEITDPVGYTVPVG